MSKTIYFDNAATSWPKPGTVNMAMLDFMIRTGASPGRSGHALAIEAGRILFQAREELGLLFNNPDTERIIFTLNCTAAINMALKSLLHEGDRAITTSMEHNSVMRTLNFLKENSGVKVEAVSCFKTGTVNLEELEKCLKNGAKLVILSMASNVTGTVQPVRHIGRMCREQGVLFMVDSAQAAGIVPLSMKDDFIDIIAFSGHKGLFGPQGTGGLCFGKNVRISPFVHGGTGSKSDSAYQPDFYPDALESGTPNTPGIAGLLAGLRFIAETGIERVREYETLLDKRLYQGLEAISTVELHGIDETLERVSVVSFTVRGQASSETALLLEREAGVMCRAGLHCAPEAHKTIGTFPDGTVRLSPGFFNTVEEVDFVVSAVEKFAGK